jgi:hypothetical protein
MWLSPEFEMIVAEWVEKWLTTGKTPVYETVQLHPYQRVWYIAILNHYQDYDIIICNT